MDGARQGPTTPTEVPPVPPEVPFLTQCSEETQADETSSLAEPETPAPFGDSASETPRCAAEITPARTPTESDAPQRPAGKLVGATPERHECPDLEEIAEEFSVCAEDDDRPEETRSSNYFDAGTAKMEDECEAMRFVDEQVSLTLIEDTQGCDTATNNTENTIVSTSTRTSWRSTVSSRLSGISSRAREATRKGIHKCVRLLRPDEGPIDIDACAVRKFAFRTDTRLREVQVSHAQGTWYIKLDSEIVATKTHHLISALKKHRTWMEFPVDLDDIESFSIGSITAKLTMEWRPKQLKWQYILVMNDLDIPASWSKAAQGVEASAPPLLSDLIQKGEGFSLETIHSRRESEPSLQETERAQKRRGSEPSPPYRGGSSEERRDKSTH